VKLLVIEDEKKLARSLKRGLEREGYAVDLIFSGEDGRDYLESNSGDYDLVILDVMLPGLSGYELGRELRSRGVSVPILMLTAKDTTEDKVAGLDSGADDYLVKPFAFAELLARIRSLLRRPDRILPLELKVGRLRLNPSTRQVYLSNREVKLRTKEFSLLEHFMRNPGQVLTREQIINKAWDLESSAWSNVVDAQIKNLRKKLADPKKEDLFETVRGVGYRLKK